MIQCQSCFATVLWPCPWPWMCVNCSWPFFIYVCPGPVHLFITTEWLMLMPSLSNAGMPLPPCFAEQCASCFCLLIVSYFLFVLLFFLRSFKLKMIHVLNRAFILKNFKGSSENISFNNALECVWSWSNNAEAILITRHDTSCLPACNLFSDLVCSCVCIRSWTSEAEDRGVICVAACSVRKCIYFNPGVCCM